jgi:sialate O-acetylesterase
MSGTVNASLKLASLFTDHMVLQRDMPVPVWGTADPGSTLTVEFAGQKKTATADDTGKWEVTLDPLQASFEARTMTIVSSIGNQKSELKNVAVGDVWICSGQSNMKMTVKAVPAIEALEPKAKNIRSFTVKRTVAFEKQDTCEGEWRVERPDSAVAFSFAYYLQEAADVPVGIILAAWGSSSLEAWMPRDLTASIPYFKTMMDEFDADTATRERIQAILDGPQPWSGKEDVYLRRQSNILYNAMLHPLIPYACRGMVWYQGERNTQTLLSLTGKQWYENHSGMLKYSDALQQWINYLRAEWQRDDFYLLSVMLPGFGKVLETGPQEGPEHPAAHSWAWMRESQLKALALPHVGVANTIDLGDLKNIHPIDKLPLGRRLALLAERDTLGMEIEAQGPILKTAHVRGKTVVVSFDHADGLKTTDGEAPKGFWLSDASGKWVPAVAAIEGKNIVLTSTELDAPQFVRYAFAGKPAVNLINGAGLPAYPFRTDRFDP